MDAIHNALHTPPPPRLQKIRCNLANLTDNEARFMRGIIQVFSQGGMTLESLKRGEVALSMTATGECMALAVKAAPFYAGKN